MSKRGVFTVFAIVLPAILIGGCSWLNPNPNVGSPANFFPITAGSYWDYIGEGNEYASFVREVVRSTDNRGQFRENNGGTIAASVYEISPDAVMRIHFQGESYQDVNLLNTRATESSIILKAPLKVGTKWGPPDEVREIVSVTETVETPAGQFQDCVAVKITFPNSTIIEYFKETVGMVKREFESEGFKVTSTLQEYDLK